MLVSRDVKKHPKVTLKARVYNPGELAREQDLKVAPPLSSTSPPHPVSAPSKPFPHKLEHASVSGTQQGEGDARARCSNSAEFSKEQTGSQAPK